MLCLHTFRDGVGFFEALAGRTVGIEVSFCNSFIVKAVGAIFNICA
jgi:hypothetical protein